LPNAARVVFKSGTVGVVVVLGTVVGGVVGGTTGGESKKNEELLKCTNLLDEIRDVCRSVCCHGGNMLPTREAIYKKSYHLLVVKGDRGNT
jgi:predicted TIM-barrel enzyme